MCLWSRPPELLVIECFPARLDPSSWVRGSAVTLRAFAVSPLQTVQKPQ